MSLAPPFNLQAWIDANRSLLKPPVGNKCIVDGDFIIMIVGGPNVRTDYHLDEGPELFYQLEGEMVLKIQDQGQPRDIPIRAGEMFYLPPMVPHSPRRPAGSVGLVVERKRRADELDGLRWYCPNCNTQLFEAFFGMDHIEVDLPPLFEQFYQSLSARTCLQCGNVHPVPAPAKVS